MTLVIGLPETGFAAVLVHVEDAEDDAIGGVAARLCAYRKNVSYVQQKAQELDLHMKGIARCAQETVGASA